MATCSNIDFYTAFFNKKTKLVARIYKHWDGYPDNMIPLFKKFRKKMLKYYGNNNPEAGGYGHMINNGEELAAEFIRVFKPAYGDISICVDLHQNIEYLYELHTWHNLDGTGKWKLKVFEVDNWKNAEKKKLLKTVTM